MKRGFYNRNGNGNGDSYAQEVILVPQKRSQVTRRFIQPRNLLATRGYYSRVPRFSGAKPELKFFDTPLAFTVDSTAEIPATGQLCIIPQDDTQSGRDGNKAIIKSIYMHGTMYYAPGASATAADVVFMYMIQDTQANGAAPAVGEANVGIFTSANLAVAVHTLSNANRFRVLKKWVITMNSGAGVTTAYNATIRTFKFFKKCDIPIQYDAAAATGALTTIRSNNIFLVAGTAGISDDLVTVQGICRLRFSD